MDKEDLWKRFQAHMGYTDAEMTVFRSDPVKVSVERVKENPAGLRA